MRTKLSIAALTMSTLATLVVLSSVYLALMGSTDLATWSVLGGIPFTAVALILSVLAFKKNNTVKYPLFLSIVCTIYIAWCIIASFI